MGLASGVRIGTVAGAPVRIGASWFLLAVVVLALNGPALHDSRPELGALAYAVAGAYALLLLGSVLVHEISHALSARTAGLKVHAVVADLMGGHTSFEGTGLRPLTSALVALAGPASNGVLGGLALLARQGVDAEVPRLLLGATAIANLALAVFNLLPGLPLDGGQVVEAVVWAATGVRHRGTVVAAWCGRVVVVLGLVLFVVLPVLRGGSLSGPMLWALLIGAFMWRGASTALARAGVTARLTGHSVRELLVPLPVVGVGESLAAVTDRVRAGAVAVDDRGRPVGLVPPGALDAVDPQARARVTVSAVLLRQPDGWVVETDPDGELLPVIAHVVAGRLADTAVVWQGRVLGIVRTADLERWFAGR